MAEITYLLKTADGIYGPETQNRLVEWAKVGRIQPGQELSTDGEKWTSVTEIPFLDMRWSIDLLDGKPPRGPFRKEAVDALLARGNLGADVKIVENKAPWEDDKDGFPEATEKTVSSEDFIIEEVESFSAETTEDEFIIEDPPVSSEVPQAEEFADEATSVNTNIFVDEPIEMPEEPVEETPVPVMPEDNELPAEASGEEETTVTPQTEEIKEHEPLQALHPQKSILSAIKEKIADLNEKLTPLLSSGTPEKTNDTESADTKSPIEQDVLPNLEMPADENAANALYKLMCDEAEALAKLVEAETAETAAYCKASQARKERMLNRRQNLLRIIGSNADEMVNRAKLSYPEMTRDANLRQDYNALRLLQERATREAETKIASLTERLKKTETENMRLRQQSADVSGLSKALAETREKLQLREKELFAERRKFEAERQRFAMTEQSLITRLSSLESTLPGNTNQSKEAKKVKLAPWFQVKS